MPLDYETKTERIQKRLKDTMTRKEKIINWWDYHRHYVLMAGAVMLLIFYFVLRETKANPADYTVAWVCGVALDDETAEEITCRLAPYGVDLNGDGIVHVKLHQIIIDFDTIVKRGGSTDGQQELGNLMALEADLSIFQSGLFLISQPDAFQAYTGALFYLDGSMPEAGAEDWENMVVSWNQCSWLGESPVEFEIYLGGRGCWQADQLELWNQSWAFWKAIQNGSYEERMLPMGDSSPSINRKDLS